MNSDVELSATAWAVLGVLSFPGERTGYEIKAWADHSLRFFYWSPALSQVYRELKRLAELGFVSSSITVQDELRNKRIYAITESGREALAAWARTLPVSPPVLKHGVLLRVWLGHLLEPKELRAVLAAHVEWAESMRRDAEVRIEVAQTHEEWSFPVLALRWSARYYEAERDLAISVIADIDDMPIARRPMAQTRPTDY